MRLVAGLFALTLSTSLALAEGAKTPEPQAEQPRAKVGLRVVRILPDSHQALLYDKQRGTHVLADVGGSIAGYKVLSIDDDEVTLAAEGKEVVLAAPDQSWHRRGPVKAAAKPAETKVAAVDPSIIAPVIIADENGVRTVIDAKAAAATAAPASVGPWTREPVTVEKAPVAAAPEAAGREDDAEAAEAELPEKDPYFIVEPPTVTPYDEVEGETERPADPYALPEGTATVTASANPYESSEPVAATGTPSHANPYDAPATDDVEIVDDKEAEPAIVATTTPTTVIARRDLDAALADFGTLTRSLRGSFSATGAKLEQVANGSVFAKAGLRAGDVITSVDGRPVRSIDDAAELYVRAQTTRATNVQILRAGKPITLKVQIR